MTKPRIPPLEESERSEEQAELVRRLRSGPTVNIYATVARVPSLADRMTGLGRALRTGSLSHRHRELLILRTGWRCESKYEFAQHWQAALHFGMTEDDVVAVQRPGGHTSWSASDILLCRVADELHQSSTLKDETWAELAASFPDEAIIEIVMIVGYYHLVSYVCNALGIPIEDGLPTLPDTDRDEVDQ